MREIASLEELKTLLGQEVAVSDWIEINQDRVKLFADATGDHQWIHLDADRARKESPYGGTIAHGFLSLSLLPMMVESSINMVGTKMCINYGLNKVRFPSALPVGKKVRGRLTLSKVEDIEAGAQLTWLVTIEREGSDKPVCVAESLMRQYW